MKLTILWQFQMESEAGEASYGVLKLQSPVMSPNGQG
jgi:hypothetical protein